MKAMKHYTPMKTPFIVYMTPCMHYTVELTNTNDHVHGYTLLASHQVLQVYLVLVQKGPYYGIKVVHWLTLFWPLPTTHTTKKQVFGLRRPTGGSADQHGSNCPKIL